LLEVDVEGVWSVEDRFLAWTATKSSIPDLIKCGEMITEEIFEIDSKHIRYGNAEEDAEVGIREA
jgi:hypothetical protein